MYGWMHALVSLHARIYACAHAARVHACARALARVPGHAYLSVIYYSTVDEFKIASATRRTVAADHPGWQCDVKNFLRPEGGVLLPCAAGERVATAIEPRSAFWVAEEYHQDYFTKNPVRSAKPPDIFHAPPCNN